MTGPLPTPAVAYLTRTQGAQAGIVISASHNPYHDNGIKFFSATGEKLGDEIELAIEAEIDRPFTTVEPERLGKAERLDDARGRYVEFCKSTLKGSIQSLLPMRVVVDAAHGAGFKVAPAVFQELGFEVVTIGCEPDGLNINRGYGATDLTALKAKVIEVRADLGIALDGDGDRLMLVDPNGRVIDGDDIVYLLAAHWQQIGRLRGPVVGTLMTNFGIELALRELGVNFIRAQVGDRYVLEQLKAHGGVLGGEASGHVLCLDRTSTGDALVCALQVLEVMALTGKGLVEGLEKLQRLPQRMINVRIAPGSKPLANPEVQQALAVVEQRLAGHGRVVLRASGTEPLIRVTVEGTDAVMVAKEAEYLAQIVASAS